MSKDDTTGPGGLSEIVRRLGDLFDHLAEVDDGRTPHRGRREKNGMVVEYSFGKRTVGEARQPREEPPPETEETPRRRSAKPSALAVLEPVTDVFDEPDEVLILYELPGVSRKDIRCVLDGDILLLDAKTGGRLYRKETLIEPPLAPGEPVLRLRNGILEVRLAKQAKRK